MCLIWCPHLKRTRNIYLIGEWLGADLRTDTKNTCVWKEDWTMCSNFINASRKLCPKKTAAKISRGSFDQPDLQSPNDYRF